MASTCQEVSCLAGMPASWSLLCAVVVAGGVAGAAAAALDLVVAWCGGAVGAVAGNARLAATTGSASGGAQ